jgi:uncharacterized protein
VLIVLAKAPLPGRAKTRLCPPLSPTRAAALAEAALRDTLDAVASVPVRRLLVLDGAPGDWLPAGYDVVPQRRGGLADRLAGAFVAAGGPALLVGMDTPQLTPARLGYGLDRLSEPGVDAVLGEAVDGGYWAIGLRAADERVFAGVPMSSPRTCAEQRARLRALGLCVAELGPLRDVDTFDDAVAVAATAPATRFASALAAATASYAA